MADAPGSQQERRASAGGGGSAGSSQDAGLDKVFIPAVQALLSTLRRLPDRLAELIQTYEGFLFDLKIVDSSDELE